MAENLENYDHILTSILEKEKSIIGFLSAIFGFLSRRTDFYYVPEGPYENMGFPAGVAEELVVKVLRKCDPNNLKLSETQKSDLSNEIMCSTVAQEVEIIDDQSENPPELPLKETPESTKKFEIASNSQTKTNSTIIPDDYKPPVIPEQNSESYNGAVRDKYTWSQTIMDLDIIIKLPANVKSSKDLRVVINAGDILVTTREGDVILKDSFPFKIKTLESIWSISEGRLLIQLEKVQERWWDKLLNDEEPINLDKIDSSRPLTDLPEDHIAKVRELQWNQEQKMKGLPTTDEIRNIQILKKAWNSPGSPFMGKEFDPSVLYKP